MKLWSSAKYQISNCLYNIFRITHILFNNGMHWWWYCPKPGGRGTMACLVLLRTPLEGANCKKWLDTGLVVSVMVARVRSVCIIFASIYHDDVIKWKHFPRNWPFVRGIHRSPVNSSHKGQWRGALMFSLICVWINDWVNNREAGDLRRYSAHYDVIVMSNGSEIAMSDFNVTHDEVDDWLFFRNYSVSVCYNSFGYKSCWGTTNMHLHFLSMFDTEKSRYPWFPRSNLIRVKSRFQKIIFLVDGSYMLDQGINSVQHYRHISSTHIHIHVHVHIHIHVHVHVHVQVHVHLNIHTHIHIHIYMHMHIYVRICIWIYSCTYACIDIYIYIYIYIHA